MVDSHCHIISEFYSNVSEVFNKLKTDFIILCGTNIENSYECVSLASTYSGVFTTIGIHPSDVEKLPTNYLSLLEDMLISDVIGIGEIGLDYHYEGYNKELQKVIFIEQLDLAVKLKLPVVIHCRDAYADTYDILSNYKGILKMVLHCYSGSLEMAYKFIDLGCSLGIGGVVTFKNSRVLKEVVSYIPMKYLVLETDSPFLTPEPYRGSVNNPNYIEYIAIEVAKLKKISYVEVLAISKANVISKFDLVL